jgi:hydroxymethylbilane synthase
LAQTRATLLSLISLNPAIKGDIRPIVTKGDDLTATPEALGLKGLFSREIEKALLAGEIDVAIHSAKDLPIELPWGLTLGPIPERGPAVDALVTLEGLTLEELPSGSKVGTSSLRRKALIMALRPDLIVVPVRGNLETRLAHLTKGTFTALCLAEAGLVRLNQKDWPRVLLDPAVFPPAPGQGALALEIRANDPKTARLLAPLNHPESALRLALERGVAAALGVGCQTPAAAYAAVKDGSYEVTALVLAPDGGRRVQLTQNLTPTTLEEARDMGLALGRLILSQGGLELLAALNGASGASGASVASDPARPAR